MRTLLAIALSLAATTAAATDPSWLRTIGTRSHDAAFGLAADPQGGVYLGFVAPAKLDFSSLGLSGAFEPVGSHDSIVLAFAPDGNAKWQQTISGAGRTEVRDVAVTGRGDVLAVGYFFETLEAPEGALRAKGGSDLFIVRIDDDGKRLSTRTFGSKGSESAVGVAAWRGGSVVVGSFEHAIRFGDNEGKPRILAGRGGRDAFVALFDHAGEVVAAHAFGGPGADSALAVAARPGGGFDVLLAHHGGVLVGDQEIGSAGADALLLRFDAEGVLALTQTIASAGPDAFEALAVDSDDRPWVGGRVVSEGALRIGRREQRWLSQGSSDGLVLQLDTDLTLRKAVQFGNDGADSVQGLATGTQGGVLLAAAGVGKLTLGGHALEFDLPQAYVARLNAEGEFTAAAATRSSGVTQSTALSALPGGRYALAGIFEGKIEQAAGESQSVVGKADVFLRNDRW